MQKRLSKVLMVLLGGMLIAGCGGDPGHDHGSTFEIEPRTGEGPIIAVATTGMIADAVMNVGGDLVDVTGLMGPGVDPHLYKATESDIRRLADAEIIFYNGLHLEGKMGDVINRMASRKPVVRVTDGIDRSKLLSPPEFEGQYDPHVWFDVSLWMDVVENIRDALIKFSPDDREQFESNAENYLNQLQQLHNYALEQIALIPEQQRVLITAHDAFGYFGNVYGIEVMGIQGMSTDTEASVRHINDLVDFMVERQIRAVFVETTIPHKNVQALIEGCRARGHQVVVGGELFSDAMGPTDTPEGTYTGMVRHNVDTIVNALK